MYENCKVSFHADGLVVNGCADIVHNQDHPLRELCKKFFGDTAEYVIVSDPPYGNIVDDPWDHWPGNDVTFAAWLFSCFDGWSRWLPEGGAMYVWGGLGSKGFRPFPKFIDLIEKHTDFTCHNQIVWSKRRAYGVSHNYLFTRQELAYFVKGDPKHPRVFNVPLLDKLRGYEGFDPDHPAKSEFYRRTNVWTDFNEIFQGKVHKAQKPDKAYEIPIAASSKEGDVIIDPFGGSGVAGWVSASMGRRFLIIEKDPVSWQNICNRVGKQLGVLNV